jgi:threonine dehydrogenase-like Zn-dependent dehydrogenase
VGSCKYGVKVGQWADAAFEAIGLPLTISQAIKSVRAGGRAVIIGLSRSDAEASFNINALVRRGVQIIGSYGGIPSRDIPAILDLLSRGVLNIDYIVQNVYEGIDEIPRALKELEQGKVLGRHDRNKCREC